MGLVYLASLLLRHGATETSVLFVITKTIYAPMLPLV